MKRRKMPAQKPGKSKQDYQTPKNLIDAIKKEYEIKQFRIDLAASKRNAQAQFFFSKKTDAFKQDWVKAIGSNGSAWLNPPYTNIGKWTMRCAESAYDLETVGSRIFLLVPASVGSNWFADMYRVCHVVALNGRITFVGHKKPYPKDCILAIFGELPYGLKHEHMSVWRWKK